MSASSQTTPRQPMNAPIRRSFIDTVQLLLLNADTTWMDTPTTARGAACQDGNFAEIVKLLL